MGMQLPMDTLFGLAIQQGSGASEYLKMAAGYERSVTQVSDIQYYRLTDLGFSPLKGQDDLPPEISPRALSGGTFTTGVYGAGPVSLIPRMDDRFGWLLLAAFGEVSTLTNTSVENMFSTKGGDTGINTHVFQFKQADQYFQPWLTLHRLLPHTTAGERLGEIFQDGRINALTVNAAAAAPVTADLDIMARVKQSNYVFNTNPGWNAVYDNFDHFGVTSCNGFFKIGGTQFPVTAVSFTLVNNLLPPAQSITIGTVHPLDFPNLGRIATVTATILVENYDLFESFFKGSAADVSTSSGENVACTVYDADVDVTLASQTYITGTTPYKIRIVSNDAEDNVSWTVAPIRVVPGRPIVMQVTGNIKAVSGTSYPLYFGLQNAKANYSLPTYYGS